jgi:7-cyano-7-deazaguanine synthase in queuosine biosynthesis
MTDKKKALVLLSGGLDSTTVLAMANAADYETYVLSFRYGQRHRVELDSATRVAAELGAADHIITDIDLRAFGCLDGYVAPRTRRWRISRGSAIDSSIQIVGGLWLCG